MVMRVRRAKAREIETEEAPRRSGFGRRSGGPGRAEAADAFASAGSARAPRVASPDAAAKEERRLYSDRVALTIIETVKDADKRFPMLTARATQLTGAAADAPMRVEALRSVLNADADALAPAPEASEDATPDVATADAELSDDTPRNVAEDAYDVEDLFAEDADENADENADDSSDEIPQQDAPLSKTEADEPAEAEGGDHEREAAAELAETVAAMHDAGAAETGEASDKGAATKRAPRFVVADGGKTRSKRRPKQPLFQKIRAHMVTAAFMILAGGLGAAALSFSGLVEPRNEAAVTAPVEGAAAPETESDAGLEGGGSGLETGDATVAPPMTGPERAVLEQIASEPEPRPFLDEFALEALLIENPVHCVLSDGDACAETLVYEPDAGLFYRERRLSDGEILEINGAYELDGGAICHKRAGLTAMVLSETMPTAERARIESAALAELGNGGARNCWRMRPVAADEFEAVRGERVLRVRMTPLI